jgi:hypothetical protein
MHTIAKRLLFCLLMLCAFNAKAQTPASIPLFYEKVYLHTDRDIYLQGEDVWFKAYLVDAQNNKLINYSHNLYVELISPGLKIVTRHVLRMEGGLGNGDFKLADTLSAGIYRLWAYTNWMRNFGDKFVFEKTITVIGTSGKQVGAVVVNKAVTRLKKKQAVAVKRDTLPPGPLVRFFPEGGSLVNDVNLVVAVKAEDEFGRGIAATGQVVATSSRVVAKFVCDSLGFGSFTIEPDETQDYHAEVMIKGQPYTFKVRRAMNKGFTLGANAVSPFIVADINCNRHELSESGGSNLVIVARHGTKVIYKEAVRVQSKNILVQIPDVNFPEGIACITLYDEHAKPLCERLVYVHHANSTTLTISTDSASYHSKQKVTVKIKLSDSTRTNLSLAAVDAGLFPVQPGNIVSYFELKSEIKGNIEHPERYFDPANPNRDKQLDLLLLTQGWRDMVWKDLEDTKFTPQYDVEQALTLTGRVRNVWTDKALPKMSITMFAPKAIGDKLFTAISDSLGKFRIDGPIFYGYQYLNFNSRRSDGMDMGGKSKGKTGGWIIVDSLFQNLPEVKPLGNLPADTIAVNSDAFIAREQIKQKFSFSGINALKTVQIKSNIGELPPETYAITATEQKEYGSVGQYVASLIPNSHWVMPDDEPPLLYTGYILPSLFRVSVRGAYSDRSPVTVGREPRPIDDEYWGLPMNKVLKVTIFCYQSVDGKVYSVLVLMRPGALKVHDTFDNTMADVVGYTKARVFYKPRYETPDNKPDYRSTLHWEPNITTDAKGEATINYYNADPKTKIQVIVQGVTGKGVPVAATAGYEVK